MERGDGDGITTSSSAWKGSSTFPESRVIPPVAFVPELEILQQQTHQSVVKCCALGPTVDEECRLRPPTPYGSIMRWSV